MTIYKKKKNLKIYNRLFLFKWLILKNKLNVKTIYVGTYVKLINIHKEKTLVNLFVI